jgi:hypothetical protein
MKKILLANAAFITVLMGAVAGIFVATVAHDQMQRADVSNAYFTLAAVAGSMLALLSATSRLLKLRPTGVLAVLVIFGACAGGAFAGTRSDIPTWQMATIAFIVLAVGLACWRVLERSGVSKAVKR